MSYDVFFLFFYWYREIKFPARKWLLRIGRMALLLLLTPQVYAEENIEQTKPLLPEQLKQKLHDHATQHVSSFLKDKHWPEGTSNVNIWLPESASHLPSCEEEIQVQTSNENAPPWGRVNYQLICPHPSWVLHARVETELVLPIQVTKHELDKNHEIQPNDLEEKLLEVSKIHRDFTPLKEELLGMRTTRRMRANQVLSPAQLRSALLVKKGDIVLIRASGEGFSASMKGEALSDGSKGDNIKVRNLTSEKVIQARVVENGIVETLF